MWVVKWCHNFARVSSGECMQTGSRSLGCASGWTAGIQGWTWRGYLPSRSTVLVHQAWLWDLCLQATRTALQPVSDALGPPLALAGQALRVAGGQAWQALAGVDSLRPARATCCSSSHG